MPPIVWLGIALAAGVGAYLVGAPAWRQSRARETRDLNLERYRAWRGIGTRGAAQRPREGLTGEERRRLAVGAALAGVAVIGVLAFFLTS